MSLVHELKELVDNGFEELPMRLEESRVLTDNVHDVRSTNSLVVFALLHLGEAQQVFDDRHKESLLCFLV